MRPDNTGRLLVNRVWSKRECYISVVHAIREISAIPLALYKGAHRQKAVKTKVGGRIRSVAKAIFGHLFTPVGEKTKDIRKTNSPSLGLRERAKMKLIGRCFNLVCIDYTE